MEGLGEYRWFAQVTIWAGRLPSFAFVPVIPGSYGIFTGQIAWLRELWPKTFKREIERWLQGIYFWRLYLLVPESVKWNLLPGRSLLISPVVRAFVQGWSTVKQNVSYKSEQDTQCGEPRVRVGKNPQYKHNEDHWLCPRSEGQHLYNQKPECILENVFQHHWITRCFESIPNHNISFNWIKYHVAFRRQFEIHFEFRSVV